MGLSPWPRLSLSSSDTALASGPPLEEKPLLRITCCVHAASAGGEMGRVITLSVPMTLCFGVKFLSSVGPAPRPLALVTTSRAPSSLILTLLGHQPVGR